jgi:hypothetical protein
MPLTGRVLLYGIGTTTRFPDLGGLRACRAAGYSRG